MRETDYKRKLVEYFKKNSAKGYTPDALKWALIRQGYSRPAVEKALDQANREIAVNAPILQEKPIEQEEIIEEQQPIVAQESPSFLRRFKPNMYNILIPLIAVGIAYLLSVFSAQFSFLAKSSNLLMLLVGAYLIVSLVKE